MFGRIRSHVSSFVQALGGVAVGLDRIAGLLAALVEREGSADLADRVDALERSRALWEAEIEGEAQRAESKFRLARAAEERTRAMARSVTEEGDDEGLDDIPEQYRRLLSERDGEGGSEEGLQPVREVVGPSRQERKNALRRYKFGG